MSPSGDLTKMSLIGDFVNKSPTGDINPSDGWCLQRSRGRCGGRTNGPPFQIIIRAVAGVFERLERSPVT
jgi:hypothetical protein